MWIRTWMRPSAKGCAIQKVPICTTPSQKYYDTGIFDIITCRNLQKSQERISLDMSRHSINLIYSYHEKNTTSSTAK